MDLTRNYLARIRRVLRAIEPEQIRSAAALVAPAMARGGVVHTFGTGHSSLLAQEIFYRAGGLVAVHPILDPRLGFECGVLESTEFERSVEAAGELAGRAGFRPQDVGIVISNSGRNALPLEMAARMKAAGMKVIALTNVAQVRAGQPAPTCRGSAHPSGKCLLDLADVVLDNHCPPGDAAMKVRGLAQPLAPLSTVAGASILHAVMLEAGAMLARQPTGKPPAIFPSANLPGTTLDDLKRLISLYQDRISLYRPGGREKPSQ